MIRGRHLGRRRISGVSSWRGALHRRPDSACPGGYDLLSVHLPQRSQRRRINTVQSRRASHDTIRRPPFGLFRKPNETESDTRARPRRFSRSGPRTLHRTGVA